MDTKMKQAVRAAADGACDGVTFHKDGTVSFRWSYFYRMGRDADSFACKVQRQLEAAGFQVNDVEASDRWAAWPKTSYFVATMRVT